ncbi:MAG: hypothetical protein ACREQM_06855 [Candidatus Dormibacteraceae bacterium]
MTRFGRLALLVGTPLIMLAVIGAIYLEVYNSSQASRQAWMVTQDVVAGAAFNGGNVERVSIPVSSASFEVLTENPITNHLRAGHAMPPSTLLTPSDLLGRTDVLVPISFAAAPGLSGGDHVDVYVVVDGTVTEVGRNLVVASPHSIWVPPGDEADWVALQGTNATLVAVRGAGTGGPSTNRIGIQQAIAELNQATRGRQGGAGGPGGSPAPAPTPTPGH